MEKIATINLIDLSTAYNRTKIFVWVFIHNPTLRRLAFSRYFKSS